MNIRNLVLSSASALVLTTGLAFAQSNDPYTHNPTPEERAQTQQLNDQAQGQATSDTDASQAGQQQYQQQQQQYQDQQQRYQNDQQAYRDQQQDYWDQRADYNYDRTHPGGWWHDRYERASLNHFYDIPRSELIDQLGARDVVEVVQRRALVAVMPPAAGMGAVVIVIRALVPIVLLLVAVGLLVVLVALLLVLILLLLLLVLLLAGLAGIGVGRGLALRLVVELLGLRALLGRRIVRIRIVALREREPGGQHKRAGA